MSDSLAPLYERWRPTNFSEVVGQDRAVKQLARLADSSGLGGKAYFLAGPSGTGKTTIGNLIAAAVADDITTDCLPVVGLSAAAILDQEKKLRGRPLFGRGWAVVLNEVHGLNQPAIRQLLDTLERIPAHAVWILTTTDDGADKLFDGIDASPLLSRCIELTMSRRGLCEAMAERALMIARAENLDGGAPLAAVVELVKQKRNNMRMVLQAIEAGYLLDWQPAARGARPALAIA